MKIGLRFSHVGIYVTDLPQMRDFYTRVLGLFQTDEGRLADVPLVFLSRDPDEHHQIALVGGRPDEHHFNIVNQISFRTASLAELRQFHDGLANENVSEIRPITHGNAWSVYFRDPEGNRLEVFVDTPWYVTQPMREPIDFSLPDELIITDTLKRCELLAGFTSREARRATMLQLMSSGQHA